MSKIRVRYWSRPRRDAAERARYAVLVEDPERLDAVLAYGDAEDVDSPRVMVFRLKRGPKGLHPASRDLIDRRVAEHGYVAVDAPPVPWVDPRSSIGRENLERLAAAATTRESSLGLESAQRPPGPPDKGGEREIGTVTVSGEPVVLLRLAYPSGGGTAVVARDAEGLPYGTLSVNVPGLKLPPDEILVKDWSEGVQLAAAAASSELFEDTGKAVPVGSFGKRAPVWRIR